MRACRVLAQHTADVTSYRFKEMQTFPDEFDGMVSINDDAETYDIVNILQVIGSPAAWHTHLRMWAGYLNSLVEPDTSDRYISEDLWKDVIHKEVLEQCDDIDGVGSSDAPSARAEHALLACRRNHQ